MIYFLGLISGLILFLLLLSAFITGYLIGRKMTRSINKEPLSEEHEEKVKRWNEMQESFSELMNYDVGKALERKKDGVK